MLPFRKLNTQCFIFFLLKPWQNPRFQSTKPATKIVGKTIVKEAQAALLEYLHSTRSLNFLDADNMCRNSPSFLQDLLAKTHSHTPHVDTKRSISRYLRYHPINEFEPFFESAGLSPSEYTPLLPPHMIYLNDDVLLMENHHALCNYGVPRTKMGRVFKLAPQVFGYEPGVLISKLREYENLGVSRKTLINVVASSPCILVGAVDFNFVKVVEMLKGVIGKDCDWIGEHLLINKDCCNWKVMFQVLSLLSRVFNEKQWGDLITRRPSLIFEESGGCVLSLIDFLLKFGLSVNRVCVMLHEFSEIRVVKFLSNLRLCFLFLTEIEMETSEIGRILQSHSLVLGSFTMKRTITLLTNLNVGKKRLCRVVRDDPLVMKSWSLGRRIEPLVNSYLEYESKALKKEFMLRLGFEENSKAMDETIKLFRGKGAELQERLEFIVNAGLDYEVVCKMIRDSPRILSQTTDRIKMKIDSLVNEGYSISDLETFPSFLSYSAQRVKLRFSMYNWLKQHGAAEEGLALSTIIACSEKAFEKLYVKRHPSGLQVWQDLKAQISSKRDAATAPNVGDRVPYVIIKATKGAKAYEKSEDPIYVLENNIPIDTKYYLENQISKPILRIFEPIIKKASRELLRGSHTTSNSNSNPSPSNNSISKFFKKELTCIGCKAVLGKDHHTVCSHCKGREIELYCKTVSQVSELEKLFGRLWTQCQDCQGSLDQDVLCTSRDCPIFYRPKKAQKDMLEAKSQLDRWSF